MLDYGDTFHSDTIEIRDADGDLGDASSVVVTVTLPDGTTDTPGIAHPAIGQYAFDYPTDQAGRHTYTIVATGGVLGSNPETWSDTFDVQPEDPGFIVSLADARQHLGKSARTDDEELRGFLAAVTRVIEDDSEVGVGPVVVREFTERHPGCGSLVLDQTPVVEIVSVEPWLTSGTTYDPDDLIVDSDAGVVERSDGAEFTGGPFAVTYTAGRAVIPSNIRLAALSMIKFWWDSSQRGPRGRPELTGDASTITLQSGYTIPIDAATLLRADRTASV